jgi:hypothetical protein
VGSHDEYGKKVLLLATKGAAELNGPSVEVDLGAGFPARIDGTVGGNIAVEVESRTPKQVRGAILDLMCHPYPKKLLLILPVHMAKPDVTPKQSDKILARFLSIESYHVLLLTGSGDDPRENQDARLVSAALAKLGHHSIERPTRPDEPSGLKENSQGKKGAAQPRRPGGKYAPLENYLRELPHSIKEVSLTFEEIEKILGFSLPTAATRYREWWANQTDVSRRPQARAWTAAGFRVETVRYHGDNLSVRFMRQ